MRLRDGGKPVHAGPVILRAFCTGLAQLEPMAEVTLGLRLEPQDKGHVLVPSIWSLVTTPALALRG